jgi:membrane fusion protein (multidrug efflux system)
MNFKATVIVVLLAATGCGGSTAETRTVPEHIFTVETVVVRSEDVRITLSAVGNVEASAEAAITPQVDGIIAKVHFEEGARVLAGQTLIHLDDRKARASLALAEAALDSAQARLQVAVQKIKRHRDLIAEDLVSRQAFETAEADHLAAAAAVREQQAAVTLAQRKLDDYELKAPFAGVLGERIIDPGNYVKPGTHLVTLMKTDPVEVTFGVPDRHGPRLATGMAVAVTVAGSRQNAAGVLSFINPKVDQGTRMLNLKATIPNARGRLRPGQFVEVTLITEVRKAQVVIPEEAVLPVGGKTWVFVVGNSIVEKREISLGKRLPERVEVLHGLNHGEKIVTAGQHRLKDGDRVQDRKPAPGPGA